MEITQCEKLIIDFNPWVRGSATPRQCKRRATVGENYCHQHGGGRCYCARYENHSGGCRGPACNCHG